MFFIINFINYLVIKQIIQIINFIILISILFQNFIIKYFLIFRFVIYNLVSILSIVFFSYQVIFIKKFKMERTL